ncbi:MAG: hypothetical protein ABIK39_01690 [candidate division WOR-3 bacterium]
MIKRILFCLSFLSATVFAGKPPIIYWDLEERPEEPPFPVLSLRVKALGEEFLGIVADLRSDILLNPSLIPLLEENEVAITFLPNMPGLYYRQNLIASSVFLPKLFIRQLGFGAHNQFTSFSYGYQSFYYDYYLRDEDFSSFQQSLFLPWSLSPLLKLALSYTFTRSPLEIEGGYESENYEIENKDTVNIRRYTYGSQLADILSSHQFGLGTTFNFSTHLLQLTFSYKKGKNEIDYHQNSEDYLLHTDSSFYTYDSSYHYLFWRRVDYLTTGGEVDDSKEGNEIKFTGRFSKAVEGEKRFNALLNLAKSSANLKGRERDSSYNFHKDSVYERWQNYPNPESTDIDTRTLTEYFTKNLNISGRTEKITGVFGLGYEYPINKSLKGFWGLKTVWAMEKDSVQKEGLEIFTDSLTDSNLVSNYQVNNINTLTMAIPLGLEYKISSLILRGGITPKFTYQKSIFKDERKTYPDLASYVLDIAYSWGITWRVLERLSFDAYNSGNLFTLKDWLIQFSYWF